MLTRAAVGFGAALLLALVVPHAAGRGRFGSEAAADRPLAVPPPHRKSLGSARM